MPSVYHIGGFGEFGEKAENIHIILRQIYSWNYVPYIFRIARVL